MSARREYGSTSMSSSSSSSIVCKQNSTADMCRKAVGVKFTVGVAVGPHA